MSFDVGVDEDVVGGRHGEPDVELGTEMFVFFFLPVTCAAQADRPVDSETGTFLINLHMWMRLNVRKALVSTWPCATRAEPTSMWMRMTGSPFNWPFHTSCSVCVPSETTKPCFGCRNNASWWFRFCQAGMDRG